MATVELPPGESFSHGNVRIEGEWVDGEYVTRAKLGGWIDREFELEINESGGHVDGIDYFDTAPREENELILAAIAAFARGKSMGTIGQQIITVEDPNGNLL